MTTLTYTEFCTYPLSKKIDFFDNEVAAIVESVEGNQLFKFLKTIILNITENALIRRFAINILVESVFLGKIKDRQAISVLVDDWEESPHIFVEIQRIKDLFYFFDLEPDIQKIYNSYLKNPELEIVTEVQLNLGYIYLQKGFESVNKEEMIVFFQGAIQHFREADSCIENRVDAKFYRIFSAILLDLLSKKTANIANQLNQLSEILNEKWLYSFDFKENVMDVSFHKSLIHLSGIIKEKPAIWTEYSFEFNKLYENYAEIKNQEIKKRLNKSKLSSLFLEMCDEYFLEPYFSLNFHAQIVKIDNCISKYSEGLPIHTFLTYLKKIAEDKNFKKKVDAETIVQKIKNIYPERNETAIEQEVSRIKDFTNPIEILNALEEINGPSIENFIDTLISASIKLQANRVYRGVFSEDDRNTYISDLLESGGYRTKDQTRQGTSYAGKSAGEIDILVKDSKGLPFTIIEALNLTSVDTAYISKHINKLFNNYDMAGYEFNFIVVYANVINYFNFCKNYINYVSKKHFYKYPFLSCKELPEYRYTDLKVYQAEHIRQGNKVFLIHVIINLSEL
jgi:hypothetical protein